MHKCLLEWMKIDVYVYTVDASVPAEQQVQRQAARRKYTSCPNNASLNQYSYKDPHVG